jgi:stage IV sporulation protein FB
MPMFEPGAPGTQPRGLQILRLFGIPVYIEPAFLFLIAIVFMINGGSGDLVRIGLLCFVIFFSLLVHEFGHAIVSRIFGCDAIRIVLTGLGGYATHTPTTRGKSLLITLAGPSFGYALGFAAYFLYSFRHDLIAASPGGFRDLAGAHIPAAEDLLLMTAFINIFWSTFNLLPIHPMDGGQSLFHVLTYRLTDHRAMLYVTRLSMILCVPLAFYAFQIGWIFAAFILALLFLDNLRMAQALS